MIFYFVFGYFNWLAFNLYTYEGLLIGIHRLMKKRIRISNVHLLEL